MSDVEPAEISITADEPDRRRGRRIGAALAAVAVVAGGLFAVLSLSDDANGPEDAVRALLAAVEQGDVLGALEQLEPGERDALRAPLVELVDELNRLDVLEGADLGDLSGVELTIDDLELESEQVADHVAAVRIVGGEGSYRFEPAALPLGGFVRDLLGDGLDEAEVAEGSDELRSSGPDDLVATVKRGDRWYVSIGYSIAEAARRDAGVAFDELGEGVAAEGADSPEGAVEALVAAVQDLDLRRVLAVLPPGELGALQEYAGLFLDDAEASVDGLGDEIGIDVQSLVLESEVDGDHGVVFAREASVDADFGDGGSLSYADGCATLTLPGEAPEEVCPGDEPTGILGGDAFEVFGDVGEIEPPALSFEDEVPEVGIAVVRVDGKWFVSPTRTVLDALVEVARLFEPGDLEELRRYVGDVFEAIGESFSTGFGFSDELDACIEASTTPEEADACFEDVWSVPTTTWQQGAGS